MQYSSITTPTFDQPGTTSLGQTMPDVSKTPVLTQIEGGDLGVVDIDRDTRHLAPTGKLSMIENGMTFTGNALLQGACTIAGHVVGNLTELAGESSQVVITETGSVQGDVFARKVSVMGACTGTIDASGGSVDLHAKSVVNGHIRYGQLQVNGADLNATLERVTKSAR